LTGNPPINNGPHWPKEITMSRTATILKILLFSLLILLCGSQTGSAFTRDDAPNNDEPGGANIAVLVIDPQTPPTLYAGTGGRGVFETTNSGATWNTANTGLPVNADVPTLAIDPNKPTTLYAGTSSSGVFKTTNGGQGWSAFNAGLTDINVTALVVDPVTPTKLYAGTRDGHVFAIQQVAHRIYLPLVFNAFHSTPSAAKIYFAAGDTLYRMNLDGSDVKSVVSGLGDNSSQSMVADPVHSKIYINRWPQSAQIYVFDVSTGDLRVFSDGPGEGGQGLAIDLERHKLYGGLYYNGVYAMDMNRPGTWTQLVDSAALYPMHGERGQLQIDPANRHIYFRTPYNGECGECRYIWRVGFDGSGLTKIIPANGGDALDLDLAAQKMYFSDRPSSSVPGDGTIKRANLDGSISETLLTLPAPYRFCYSIHLDVGNQMMYMSLDDEDSGHTKRAIARAKMDGSGFEILHTMTGDTWLDVLGDMTLFFPVPESAPLLVR
jgi:hypothetical protein